MAAVKTMKTIMIDENIDYQTSFWKVQHIGRIMLVALLTLAVFGLLGDEGIANSRTVGNRQFGLTADIEPYLHRDASTEMTVTLFDMKNGTASFFISEDYLAKMQITSVSPLPRSVQSVRGGNLYIFDTDADAASATFYATPDNTAVGSVKGRIGPTPERTLSLNQWVYP